MWCKNHSLRKYKKRESMSFKYEGWLTYQDAPRRGDKAKASLTIGFFPPHVRITIFDPIFQTEHTLTNSRFNFQSRDSLVDLLARDQWTTDWIDMLDGDLDLIIPTLTTVTPAIRVTLYASWWPAFCIVDFQQGSDYCQIATRPRTLMQARWTRRDIVPNPNHVPNATPDLNHDTHPNQPNEEPQVENVHVDSPRPSHPEADSTYDIDWENADNPSKTLNHG